MMLYEIIMRKKPTRKLVLYICHLSICSSSLFSMSLKGVSATNLSNTNRQEVVISLYSQFILLLIKRIKLHICNLFFFSYAFILQAHNF